MILCFFVIAACLFAATPLHAEPLDLQQAERLAIERNLALQASILDSRAAAALVRGGYGIYDPRVEATADAGESREQINLTFISETEAEILEYRDLELSLAQNLPTGGEFSLFFETRREDSNSTTRLLNPSYRSAAGIRLVQPLLRDFGRVPAEREILFAVKDRDISLEELRRGAFDLVAEVRNAWFEVIEARDRVTFRESSLALAEKVLEENRARLDAGMLPAVEVLEAEVGHQLRKRDLLDARRAYRDTLDRVALLLNLDQPPELRLEEMPIPEIAADEERAYLLALEKRPVLLAQRQSLERLALERRLAGNRKLPVLDLFASYGRSGLGDDLNASLDDVADSAFRDWEAGVTFSYPIGNRAAREDYNRLDLRYRGEVSRLRQLRQEIRTEIRRAIRQLEVGREQVAVADRSRELAEEQLRTLLGRQAAGVATTRDVLDGEEDLARARNDQIAALSEYNGAVTDYLRTTGQLLEHEGIRLHGIHDGTPSFRMDLE